MYTNWICRYKRFQGFIETPLYLLESWKGIQWVDTDASHCSAFEWPLRYLDYLISRTFWELYGQQPRKNMWDDLQISM